MAGTTKISLGQSIDDIIIALNDLDGASQLIAVRAACEHLNIPIENVTKILEKSTPLATVTASKATLPKQPLDPKKIIDIRTFKEEKQPGNAIEMACVAAFYLENFAPEAEKKDTMTNKDIAIYFNQANFPLPKVPTQVLPDTKSAGYFDSRGRGKYKLNPVGHNLVAHSLPKGKK